MADDKNAVTNKLEDADKPRTIIPGDGLHRYDPATDMWEDTKSPLASYGVDPEKPKLVGAPLHNIKKLPNGRRYHSGVKGEENLSAEHAARTHTGSHVAPGLISAEEKIMRNHSEALRIAEQSRTNGTGPVNLDAMPPVRLSTYIEAEPGMGKSTLAAKLAHQWRMHTDEVVFSKEGGVDEAIFKTVMTATTPNAAYEQVAADFNANLMAPNEKEALAERLLEIQNQYLETLKTDEQKEKATFLIKSPSLRSEEDYKIKYNAIPGKVLKAVKAELHEEAINRGILNKDGGFAVKTIRGKLLNILLEMQARPTVALIDEITRKEGPSFGNMQLWQVLNGDKRFVTLENGDEKYVLDNAKMAANGSVAIIASNVPDALIDPEVDPLGGAIKSRMDVTLAQPSTALDYAHVIDRELLGIPVGTVVALGKETFVDPITNKLTPDGQAAIKETRDYVYKNPFAGTRHSPDEKAISDLYMQGENLKDALVASNRLGQQMKLMQIVDHIDAIRPGSVEDKYLQQFATPAEIGKMKTEAMERAGNATKKNRDKFDLRLVGKIIRDAKIATLSMQAGERTGAFRIGADSSKMTSAVLGTAIAKELNKIINENYDTAKSTSRKVLQRAMITTGYDMTIDPVTEDVEFRANNTAVATAAELGMQTNQKDTLFADAGGVVEASKAGEPKNYVTKLLNKSRQLNNPEQLQEWAQLSFNALHARLADANGVADIDGNKWVIKYAEPGNAETASYYLNGSAKPLSAADARNAIEQIISVDTMDGVLNTLPVKLRDAVVSSQDIAKENNGHGAALAVLPEVVVSLNERGQAQFEVKSEVVIGPRDLSAKGMLGDDTFNKLDGTIDAALKGHKSPGPGTVGFMTTLALAHHTDAKSPKSEKKDFLRAAVVEDFRSWLAENDKIPDVATVEGRAESGLAITTIRVGDRRGKDGKSAPAYITVVMQGDNAIVVGDEKIDPRLGKKLAEGKVKYISRDDPHAETAISDELQKFYVKAKETELAAATERLTKEFEAGTADKYKDKDADAKKKVFEEELKKAQGTIDKADYEKTLIRAFRHRVGPGKDESGADVKEERGTFVVGDKEMKLPALLADPEMKTNPRIPELVIEVDEKQFAGSKVKDYLKTISATDVQHAFKA